MGFLRKSAYLASGGVIAPRSRKDRRQAELVAAIQGKSADEIRRAGKSGRHSFDALLSPYSDPKPDPESEREAEERHAEYQAEMDELARQRAALQERIAQLRAESER